MDATYGLIIIAVIGFAQVIAGVYFARRSNKAMAAKDDASATEAISSSYSTLVRDLESRLAKLEKNYDDLCEEYEADKLAWALERAALFQLIEELKEE